MNYTKTLEYLEQFAEWRLEQANEAKAVARALRNRGIRRSTPSSEEDEGASVGLVEETE